MMDKQEAKKRSQILKRLRDDHRETVERTQALLREQKEIRRQLCQVMRDESRTIPDISAASGLPADRVLWHVNAMRKYDLVVEAGMCGEYVLYQRAEEA